GRCRCGRVVAIRSQPCLALRLSLANNATGTRVRAVASIFGAWAGEPGGNRTLNPQIKSRLASQEIQKIEQFCERGVQNMPSGRNAPQPRRNRTTARRKRRALVTTVVPKSGDLD